MTREQAEALGQRALVAGFESTVTCLDTCGLRLWQLDRRQEFVPHFGDAATRGVLLEQVMVRLGLSSWNAVGEYTGDFSAEALVSELELAKKWGLANSPTEAKP